MIDSFLSSSRYDRVLRLLDQERKVILNGPLSALSALVEKREALLSELLTQDHVLPEAFLQALKTRAERNSRLILASIAGVRSAEALLTKLDEASETLRTYSAEGVRVDLGPVRVTRDTRA